MAQCSHHGKLVGNIELDVSTWITFGMILVTKFRGSYFLTCDGDFTSNLLRELGKLGEHAHRGGFKSAIVRDIDLQLALFRASLGTNAQDDACLSSFRLLVPQNNESSVPSASKSPKSIAKRFEAIAMDGLPVQLIYKAGWPMDLLLQDPELELYSSVFSYLIAIRKVHATILLTWASISQMQRARRIWSRMSEGGGRDESLRKAALQRCWTITSSMIWFLDIMLNYVMGDVVQVEFQLFTTKIRGKPTPNTGGASEALDLTTLRQAHAAYLLRVYHGCLLSNEKVASSLSLLLECCVRLSGQIKSWGGDALPPLLPTGTQEVGEVQARLKKLEGIERVRT
jgi:gamma-tubulin complex component 4